MKVESQARHPALVGVQSSGPELAKGRQAGGGGTAAGSQCDRSSSLPLPLLSCPALLVLFAAPGTPLIFHRPPSSGNNSPLLADHRDGWAGFWKHGSSFRRVKRETM